MSNHTPSPWEVARALSGKTFVAIGHKIGMAGKQVCEILPNIDTGDFEANARLIAAAPELLEALENILTLGFFKDGGIPGTAMERFMKQARAAIEKAKAANNVP